MHLFGHTFDHDYYFELPRKRERDAQSITRCSTAHHRLFRAGPRANRTFSLARNPIPCATSSTIRAADVARLFKEVDSAFGRLDVLVNNAAVFRFGAFTDISEDSFHVHYNINVLGTILTVQEAIKRFGADGGSIINLSSIVGSHPVAGALLYASTKGAIETLTRGLALELAPRKIRVNAIAPGHTETEGNVAAGTFDGGAGAVLAGKTPLGRLGRVTDIAPLAVFLASDESAWITGEVIRAAGGLVVAA